MSDSEVWKDVAGYEGLYKVSNKGNIFSVERKDSRGQKCGGRMLKPRYDKDGYLIVTIYKNGVEKKKRVHRLVVEAFLPNPKNLPEVNHIDEVKDNNELSNLEWCTRDYNANYGTLKERLSKKVRVVNVETGEVITFKSVAEAGQKGYASGCVSQACRGIYYGGNLYRGNKWSYE